LASSTCRTPVLHDSLSQYTSLVVQISSVTIEDSRQPRGNVRVFRDVSSNAIAHRGIERQCLVEVLTLSRQNRPRGDSFSLSRVGVRLRQSGAVIESQVVCHDQ
jgi:hypothetical protein